MKATVLLTGIALVALAAAGMLLVPAPVEASTCYSQCEINYYQCVTSGGSGCDTQLQLCFLQCGGSSGGGGGGGGGGRGRPPGHAMCIDACFDDYGQCESSGPPPGSTQTCFELLLGCKDTCDQLFL